VVKYKNFPLSLSSKLGYYDSQVANIWRKGPESKEQANIIYKINHLTNFLEDSIIKSNGTYQNFENRFPFLPRQAITYFNINDINDEELEEVSKQCFQSNRIEIINNLKTTM
jgi:hypothetical protein